MIKYLALLLLFFPLTSFAADQAFCDLSTYPGLCRFVKADGSAPPTTYFVGQYRGNFPDTSTFDGGGDGIYFGATIGLPTSGYFGGGAGYFAASPAGDTNPADILYYIQFDGSGMPTSSSTATRIRLTIPFNADLVATGTPVELDAFGDINAVDIDKPDTTNLSILWNIQKSIGAPCTDPLIFNCHLNLNQTFSVRAPIFISGSDTQSFLTTSSSSPLFDVGIYRMTTSIQKPSTFLGFSSIFGIGLGYNTIVSTTTSFVAGDTNTYTEILNNINAGNYNASTTIELSSCIPVPGYWRGQNCMTALFAPSDVPDYQQDINAVGQKAPFRYFSLATDLFTAATTTTASTTASGLDLLGSVFQPVKDIIALLLWLLLVVWAFKRLSHFYL